MLIKTKRCTIRPFTLEDIEPFMEYRNNEEWMCYQGFKGLTKDVYKKVLMKKIVLEDGIQLAITHSTTNQLLGDMYLKKERDVYWLGYTIHPSHARNGYAYEVACSIIHWIKQQGCTSIKAGVVSENTASIKLLEKLHFTYSSTIDDERIYILMIKSV